MKRSAAVVLALTLVGTPVLGSPPKFEGEKTGWHGFDRYDFLMDETDLSIKPHKAGAGEGNAVKTQHLAGSAGELPVAGDLDGGHPQRPR